MNMQRFCSLIVATILCVAGMQAQSITNYAFTATSGTFTEISGGTTLTLGSGSLDDGATYDIPIGFDFWYMGQRWTAISLGGNGLAILQTPAVATTLATTFSNALSTTTTNRPVIAAFWDDCDMNPDSSTFTYVVTGSAGSRVFTGQVLRIEANRNATIPDFSYQIKLYEATGKIEIIYRRESGAAAWSGGSASIGISGPGSTQFVSLNGSGTSPISSTVSETTTIATLPATGQVYAFTPPSGPASPSGISFTSITKNTMTISWTDNATTESGYALYYSTNGGNTFTFDTLLAANSVTRTAGNAFPLLPGLTYTWAIFPIAEFIGTPGTGTQATSTGTISGTKSVGPGGDYTTLTAALTDLATNGVSGSVILELNSSYTSASETFPLNITNSMGFTSTRTLTIRPASGATGRSITGNITTGPMIDIRGASYVTIDGRPGGTGTSRDLVIENQATTTGTLRFINDATNNTLQYCVFRISNTSNSSTGGIVFGASTNALGTGNDNNTITNNDIREGTGGTTPFNLIYSINSTSNRYNWNSGNVITNNNIFNFYTTTGANGIQLSSGNTDWTITNNNFYQTASRAFTGTTAATIASVFISNTSNGGAVNNTVSNNSIGGSSAGAGGSAMAFTATAGTTSGTQQFIGINLAVGPSPATTVSSNTITNISVQGIINAATGYGAFTGIGTTAGSVVISNNTIGSSSSTGAITVTCLSNSTSTTSSCLSSGIVLGSGFPAFGTISNNTIGGINAPSSSSTGVGSSVFGIQVSSSAAPLVISGNTIGSTSVANSINASSAISQYQFVDGIRISSSTLHYNILVDNNTVANLNNAANGTNTFQTVRGIVTASGINTITNNTVRNLSIATGNASAVVNSTSTTAFCSAVGIMQTSTSVPTYSIATTTPNGRGQKIIQNTVHTIENSNTTAIVALAGISFTHANSSTYISLNSVDRNNVHSLNMQSSSATSPQMYGIGLFGGGTATYASATNNVVRLGINAAGSAVSTNTQVCGILRNTTTGFYTIAHNSVYIGGSAVTGGATSMGIWKANATATSTGIRDTMMNNVLVNQRTNGTGTGQHNCIYLNDITNVTVSNNLYNTAIGSGGWIGTFIPTSSVYSVLRQWQAVTTVDAGTGFGNPNYINPTGTSSTVDLHISAAGATPIEGSGQALATVPQDYDGQTRTSFTPADMGADAGNFTAQDIFAPTITYTPLANAATGSTRSLTGVVVTDASGINVTAGTRPRVYYKKITEANTFVGNTSTDNGWKWVEASGTTGSPFSFTINYSLLTSSVAVGDTIVYFVIAQDLASTPNIGINNGLFTADPASVALTAAAFPVNSVRFYRIVPSISGTLNVGPAETVNSITNTGGLFEYINGRIVTGNVIAQITGSMLSETGTVALNQTSEDGTGGYTITIRPAAGTTDTISGTVANGLIRLNSADRIIIDGRRVGETTGRNLTIINTNTGTSSAVMLINPSTSTPGCVYDTIRYCNIRTGVTPSTTATGVVSAGIHVGGATHFADADGNRGISITNNSIVRASVGICVLGSTTVLTDSIQINNNIIGSLANEGTDNLHYSGIITRNVSVGTINGNTVQGILSSITSNTLTTQGNNGIGISSGSRNLVINNNLIRRVRYTGTAGYEAIGIELQTGLATANIRISNNIITGLSNDGFSGVFDGLCGIRVGVSGNANGGIAILHNTIFMSDTMTSTTAGTPQAQGVYIGSACTNVDLRNNVIYNATLFAGTGAYKVYGIYSEAAASAFTNANFNNYYVYAPTSTNAFMGYFTSADRTSLASYSTASGLEGSSVAQYVGFVDSTRAGANFHLTQIQPTLKGTSAVSSIVSTDFDGLTRGNYIMGADEVKPVIQFTQQPSGSTVCEGGTINVSANISTPITFDDGITRTTPTATYQWLLNGTPISGATNASYSVGSITTANAGTYAVRVYASSIDSATSNSATVNVNTNASITAQPTGTGSNICPGNTTFTLSVTATGTTPGYQWQKFNGSTWDNITGATSSTYRPTAGWTTADSGSYRVNVSSTSPCSQTVTGSAVVVGVFTNVSVTAHPTVSPSNSRCLGDAFTLSATGAGSGVLYQWRLNSSNIAGATNSTYSVTSATLSDYGTYDIVVSNTCNSVTSNTIVVSQTTPTSVTTQPTATTTLCPGQNYTVNVVAAGASLTYQWQKLTGAVWSNVSGSTSSTFNIASVTSTDAASYRVNVTGTCGTVSSNNAVLNVNVTTVITTQPTQPSAVCVGDNIIITGLVANGTTLGYQWQKLNGASWNPISGATSSNYTQANAQVTDSGSYRVVVSGVCGTVNSNVITITVNSPISITAHPAWNNPNKCTGESSTISATIAGTVSTYQWQRFNGSTWVNISGASTSSYTLNNIALADSGDYRLLLTGPCSSPTSTNSARLFVQQNVQVTNNPQGTSVCAGGSISMSISTIGTVVSYQWQQDVLRNGTWSNISGATNSTYTKSNVTVADSGNYRVSIIGTCSAVPVNSTAASVVIQLPYNVTTQPTWPSTPTNVGQVVTLTVGFTGTANFQWQRDQQRNNTWVAVGTNSATYSYTVNSIADSGNYRCIVTGPCTTGSVTTNTVSVFTCQPPTFTSHPQQPSALCPGGTLSLSAQVNSQGQTIGYQWQQDANRNGTWVNVNGATNASYVNNNLQAADAGFYRMQVSSTCSAVPVNSNVVDVVLNQPITFTTHPTSQTVCVGAGVSFTVAVTGNNPSYQWFYNNAPISPGLNSTATSATLQLTNVSAGSAGSYRCFVSGSCSPNGVFSNTATLTVNNTVTISQQPQSTTGCAGTPVTFSVTAAGTGLAYQWKFGASTISGATNSTYTINSPTTANNGSYSVDITSTCGNITSSSATLTINIPATFSTQPSTQTLCQGNTASLTVVINADATSPLYQWRKDGVDINPVLVPTALSSTLVLTGTTPSNNGIYTCLVKTACQPNGISSNGATLTINPSTAIATQPTGITVCESTSATLNVVAQGTSLTYQWKKNGTDVFGATNSSYVIPSIVLTDAGNYTVVVGGACAPLTQTSNVATIAVNQRVQITGAVLTNQVTCQGANVQFATNAIGTGVVYQWRKNGVAITANSSATTATLSLTNVTPSDNGTYDCVVTGTCNPNGVSTNSATLAVNVPAIIQTTPQSQTVCQGVNVQFTSSATGSVLGYQWRYNGQPISGNATATTPTLTLNNVSAINNGTYDVVVNGVCNIATSASATLSVNLPVTITTQPLPQRGCIGSTVTTSVATSGSVLSYQWQKDGLDIPGMTTAILTIINPTSTASGIYRCIVNGSSACGTPQIISNAVGVLIGTPVVITTQPQDKSVAFGSTVTVSVEASGAGFGQNDQLFYRWYRGTTQLSDDNRINGSTTGTLTIRGIQPSDVTADYTVVVLGSCGQTTSRQFAIVVPSANIISQPQGSTICAGRPAAFSVSASATVPNSTLSYQWYRGTTALTDGGTISGATTPILLISGVVAVDSGEYTVQILVQPGGARITSNVARLNVGETPTITTQPINQEVCVNSKVTIAVAAKGIGLTYKWMFGGTAIPGVTSSTLEIPQVQSAMAGSYSVEVSNVCGAVTSSSAVITVNTSPSITEQPQATTVNIGGSFTVRVVATGSAPVTYQWRRGTTDIPGATNSTFTKSNADKTDEAEYICIVRNGCGEITTTKAKVEVSTVSVGDAEMFGYSIQSTEPNPVNDVATIRYTVAQAGIINIMLTDVNGRIIATLCNEIKEAGNHSVLLRSGDLDIASGTYQITLITPQGYSTSKRVIVVK